MKFATYAVDINYILSKKMFRQGVSNQLRFRAPRSVNMLLMYTYTFYPYCLTIDTKTNIKFLFQFYDLIERNNIAKSNLDLRSVTVFAPTNEAFQKYQNTNQVQVLYHMCKLNCSYSSTLLFSLNTSFISHSYDCINIGTIE